MKREAAEKISQENRNSYDAMAGAFSKTRATFWDELTFLADHIERDDHVLDIGCGNGRFFPLVKERHAAYTGIDFSKGLIDEARTGFPDAHVEVGDATALPFPDDSFDIAFSFAVIHHIPGSIAREQFAREAFRVLHPGGKFILTAWNLWTKKHFGAILSNAVGTLLGRNTMDIGDTMLTFGREKHPRYVHACTMREITSLLTDAGFEVIDTDIILRKSGEGNIVVVAQKPIA